MPPERCFQGSCSSDVRAMARTVLSLVLRRDDSADVPLKEQERGELLQPVLPVGAETQGGHVSFSSHHLYPTGGALEPYANSSHALQRWEWRAYACRPHYLSGAGSGAEHRCKFPPIRGMGVGGVDRAEQDQNPVDVYNGFLAGLNPSCTGTSYSLHSNERGLIISTSVL
jgi:hypothetical protein